MKSRTKRANANCRAWRLRQRIKAGAKVTDIERAWLGRYEREVYANLHRRKPPPSEVSPARVVAEVCRRFGITLARLRRAERQGIDVEMARAVAVIALRRIGTSLPLVGAQLKRKKSAIAQLYRRARGRRYVQREADLVLERSRPARRGDLVSVTVRVAIGDPLWIQLDRLAELDELSEARILARTNADRLRAE
jgi:hypothetical protein